MLRLLKNAMLDLRARLGRPACVRPVPVWFPEDLGDASMSTYSGEINVAAKTADQLRVLNANPVTVTGQLQLLLENRSRKEFIISNVGTGALVLGFGFPPTPTNFTMPLPASQNAFDGSGGILISDAWKGAVWVNVASGSTSSQVIVTEIPL